MHARSVINKTENLESIIIAHKPHIIIITESWLHNTITDSEIAPPYYKVHRQDRDSRGGEAAILFSESLSVSRLPDIPWVECVIIKVFLDEINWIIGGLYRPSNSDNTFFGTFICNHTRNLLLAGDFKIPSVNWAHAFADPLSRASESLADFVLLHNLTQAVKESIRTQWNGSSVLYISLFDNKGIVRHNPQLQLVDGISGH